jgi:hypothetical protein
MKAISNVEQRPTFTICLKKKDNFPEKNLTIRPHKFDHPIGCLRMSRDRPTVKPSYSNCSQLTQLVESLIPGSLECLSYFSQLFDQNSSHRYDDYFAFIIDNSINAFGLIHQTKTPPHFTKNEIEIPKSSRILIDYSSINMKSLPFPYSTDCSYYKSDEKSLIHYKSREDCIVKHLGRRELAECGCNKRWYYRSYRIGNLSNICPKTFKCPLNLKLETKLLEKICKKNCLNQHFVKIIHSSNYNAALKENMLSFFQPTKFPKIEILFTHLPKMNLIEYFCSIGGLISMWFGISVYDFVLIFVRETKKRVIYPLGLNRLEMLFKLRNLVSHKFNQIFSSITITVFSVLMLHQILAVIISYFDYEVVTRFEIEKIISMPKIIISKENTNALQMAAELINIYPELNQTSPIKLSDDWRTLIYFKRKLLLDNKMNDFQRIFGSEKIIKTCQIMIDNKVINFSKIDLGVHNYHIPRLVNYLNFSFIDKEKIESITISLFDFNSLYVLMESIDAYNYSHKYQFLPKKHFRTKVTFSSFSVLKLSSYRCNCITEDKVKILGDEYLTFCYINCYHKEINEIYGCIPLKTNEIFFERDIERNGYKFCNGSYGYKILSKSGEISRTCLTNCKPKCRSINFNQKIQGSEDISNETIVEFIPKKTPRIAYIETLKTDFDRLIHNCGGILGLWFGLTPIKTVELIQYLFQIYNNSRDKIKRVAQNLVTIFKRCIHCMITIFHRFICKLFAKLSIFSQNLIALCNRCVRISFLYSISIVYQLSATFKRCLIWLKAVFFRFIRNLFANLSVITHNLIVFCIRFVRNTFTHLINIVYQLSATFKICFIWLKAILFRFILNLFANLKLFCHNLITLCIRWVRNSFTYFISFA